MNEKITKSLATLTVLLFVGMAIPVSQAQSQTTTTGQLDLPSITVSPANLQADVSISTVSIPWTYVVDQAPFGLQADVKSTTTMRWDDPDCDKPGFVITGPLSNVVSITRESSGVKASASGTKQFQVQATQDAPGETSVKCTFAAQVDAIGSTVLQSSKITTNTQVIVDFLGLLSANLPGTIKSAGPQKEIKYDIELSNLGNARSTVRFDLITENVGSWDPVAPTEIILDSPNQGGAETSKTVSFQVSTPHKNGWNNDQKTFQLRITPVSTKNPDTEGTPVTINVLSRVRGVYVPSLEPMLLLGAVVGSAFVAARLRRDE